MSDDNDNDTQTGPAEGSETGEAGMTTYRVTPYLTKSKMLPVEGVVYCLEHTAIHDATVNPFGEGEESWCDEKEHRTVYYRAARVTSTSLWSRTGSGPSSSGSPRWGKVTASVSSVRAPSSSTPSPTSSSG
jgi:hypothetical protein